MKLLIFADHPIQYQAPLFRRLAARLDGDVRVVFKDVNMGLGGIDPGFGRKVTWDVPMLDGYFHAGLGAPGAMQALRGIGMVRAMKPQAVLLMLGYNDPLTTELILALRVLRVPVLWRFEGSDTDTVQHSPVKIATRRLFLKAVYSQVQAFLSIGLVCTDHLRSHGVLADRIFPSPYNIDDDLFDALRGKWLPLRSEVRAELGIADGRFVFLSVGKMIPRKNPLALVRAVAGCRSKDKMTILFVGSGPLLEDTRRSSQELGVDARFPGFANQTELGKFYSAADAAVVPSDRETWGLVVNEAMKFSLPVVVSSAVDCHRDLVIPDETGFVFPQGDIEALAGHLERLCANALGARKLGQNAGKHIEGFSADRAVDGIIAAREHVTRIAS